jgi:hypothetical protein
VPVFAWAGAGVAALVVSAFLMLKGGMVERPKHDRDGFGPMGTGGSPDGSGIPTLDDQEDPFKRFARDRSGAAPGPDPTQSETQQLYNDTWGDGGGEPAVSYASAGDGSGGRAPIPNTPEWFTGGYADQYNTAGTYQPPPSGGLSSAPNTPGYFGAPSNAPSSVPVATADPSVYRVPGTNIKMT